MSSLRITEVSDIAEFAALSESWEQLAAQDEQAGIFNDWHWNSLWWEHYGHMGELLVLLVYDEQKLIGIGPFYRTQSKALGLAKLDTLRFIGTGGGPSPDDMNILALSAMRQPVIDLICDHLFSASFPARLYLSDVRDDSSFYEAFSARAGLAAGYKVHTLIQPRRWATLPNEWAKYRQQISRNTHKQIKRRQNRLDSAGDASMHVCTTEQEVDEAFKALIELHCARWQSKGQSGSFGSSTYQAFHRSFMQRLLDRKQLWLITLKLGDQIIAVEYAFTYKGALLFLQTGFDPAFEHLSPGHVLMTFAIKQAIESGVSSIDLLKGDYEYKTSYANQQRNSATLGFYRKGVFSVLARANDFRLQLKH